eukprot:403344942
MKSNSIRETIIVSIITFKKDKEINNPIPLDNHHKKNASITLYQTSGSSKSNNYLPLSQKLSQKFENSSNFTTEQNTPSKNQKSLVQSNQHSFVQNHGLNTQKNSQTRLTKFNNYLCTAQVSSRGSFKMNDKSKSRSNNISAADIPKVNKIKSDLENLKVSRKIDYLNNLVYSSFQHPKGSQQFKKDKRFSNHNATEALLMTRDKQNCPGPGQYEDQILNTKRLSAGPSTFYKAKKESSIDRANHSPGVGSYSPMYHMSASKLPDQENPATFEKITTMLREKGIDFNLTTHEPVLTSKAAAEARGATLASGAKAMLLKDNSKNVAESALFYLAVMSASKKFSWKLLKKVLKIKNMRFATPEEVYERTGCLPGAVPPFGSSFDTPTLVDESLQKQGQIINFNCGLRTHSVRMRFEDYIKIEQPKMIAVFTEEGEDEPNE